MNNIVKLSQELEKSTSKHLNDLTMQKVVEFDPDTLLRLKNNGNEELLFDALKLMIVNLAESINVKNNLTTEQITKVARDILKYYDTLTPEDIYLCFERIIHGIYGPVYNNMSPDFIFRCIRKYGEQKDEAVKDYYRKQYPLTFKECLPADTRDNDEVAKKNLKEIYEKIEQVGREKVKREDDKHGRKSVLTVPGNILIAEQAIHYIVSCGRNKEFVMKHFGISEYMAKEVINEAMKFGYKNSAGSIIRIDYDKMYSGFKTGNFSRFATLCTKIDALNKGEDILL